MKSNMLLRKICGIYTSDLHFAMLIFPFIRKELENDTTIITVFEKNEEENIDKIIENIGLNSKTKEKMKQIDWNSSNIQKIKSNFNLMEETVKQNKKIDVIVCGRNVFIQKVNQVMDLWVKNNINILEKSTKGIDVINCFSFEANKKIEKMLDMHDYLLKTEGLEEILAKEELLKAN